MTNGTLSPDPAQGRSSAWVWVWVVLLLLTIGLRIHRSGDSALWNDEQFSVLQARGLDKHDVPNGRVFTHGELFHDNGIGSTVDATVANDSGNGILYMLILRGWTTFCGIDPFAVRGLSVVFGSLLVLGIYIMALRLFNDRILALVAMALAAFSPMLIAYGQEARSYSMGAFVALGATMSFFGILGTERASWRRYALYGTLVLASLLCHYSTLYIFAAHGVIAVLWLRERIKWMYLVATAVCVGIPLLAWMSYDHAAGLAYMGAKSAAYEAALESDPEHAWYAAIGVRSIVTGIISILSWTLCVPPSLFDLQIRWAVLFMIVPILCLVLAFTGPWRHTGPKWPGALGVLSVASMAYALMLGLLSGHDISFQPHYAIFSMPYASILLGLAIRLCWQRETRTVLARTAAVLLIVSTFVSGLHANKDHHATGPADKMAAYAGTLQAVVDAHRGDRLLVVHDSPLTALELNLYLPSSMDDIRQQVDTSAQHGSTVVIDRPTGNEYIIVWEGPSVLPLIRHPSTSPTSYDRTGTGAPTR